MRRKPAGQTDGLDDGIGEVSDSDSDAEDQILPTARPIRHSSIRSQPLDGPRSAPGFLGHSNGSIDPNWPAIQRRLDDGMSLQVSAPNRSSMNGRHGGCTGNLASAMPPNSYNAQQSHQ